MVLTVLGVTTVGLALASGTVWKPDETVQAHAVASQGTTLLITDPGILGLVDDSVTVTASRADGGPVALAIAREHDILGWVGSDAHTVVTGLKSLDTLNTSLVAGDTVAVEAGNDKPDDADKETAAAPLTPEGATASNSGLVGPDPADSDMWLTQAVGDNQATLTWAPEVVNDRHLLLVANTGDNAPPPDISLTWKREVSTPLLVPGVAVGVVLILSGLLVFLSSRRKSAAERRTLGADGQRSGTDHDDQISTPSAVAARRASAGEPNADVADPVHSRRRADEEPSAQTGVLRGSVATPVAGPTTPVVSHSPEVADDEPTQPMSRRQLREMAEQEALEQAQNRKTSRPKKRRSAPKEQATEEPAQDAPETRATRSTQSVRSTRSVRSSRSARSSISAITGSFPQVAPPTQSEDIEANSQDRNRADAWRKAWGFQQSWDPQENDQGREVEGPEEDKE